MVITAKIGNGLHPPLSVIETWPKPNYVNPVTEGPGLQIVGIFLTAIATLLVTARIYSRIFITRALGLDDYLVVVSLLTSIAMTVLIIIGNKEWDSGRHIWDVPVSNFVGNRKNVWETETYIVATCSVKISVLLFYRRLSASFSKAFLIAVWVGIVYNLGYLVAFLLNIALACLPIQAYWRQFDPIWAAENTFICINEKFSLPSSAALSVLGDLYSTLLPLLLIMNLDLPSRQKGALYPLFALGFIVVAAGIARTIYLNHLINETYDNTWYIWKFWMWTFVEIYVAIIAASAPALKPFFNRYFILPALSSKGKSPYTESSPTQVTGGRRALWSNTSTIARGGEEDLEKVGVTLEDDEVKRYEMRTLPSGKVEPVQIIVAPQRAYELPQSETSDSSFVSETRGDWIIPTREVVDDTCPLRAYRAGIEPLPALPEPSADPLFSDYGIAQNTRSFSSDQAIRSTLQQSHVHNESMSRYATQVRPRLDLQDYTVRAHDLHRPASQGSVKNARLRAESFSRPDAARMADARPRRTPTSPDRGEAHAIISDPSSSDETLDLPRQSINARERDDGADSGRTSLHLPRQGGHDDVALRRSMVGLAV